MTVNASQPHCENCGAPNPQTADGYTGCCNELVCDGRFAETWAVGRIGSDNNDRTQTGTVRACCSAVAQVKAGPELDVLHRVS